MGEEYTLNQYEEKIYGTAILYGYNTVDLKPGETADVQVSVYDNTETHDYAPSWSNLLAFTYHALSESLSWNNIGFKVKYHVYANIGADVPSYLLIYSGYDTSIQNPRPDASGYILNMEFEPFSLRTSHFQSGLIQD